MTELWCYIEGKRTVFSISISPDCTIDALKKQIYEDQFIVQCCPSDLSLTKVDVALTAVDDKIMCGEYRPNANDQPKSLVEPETMYSTISEVWPKPLRGYLHVFVALPSGVGGSMRLPLSPRITLRNDTVSALYKKLKKNSFILVRGTPGSGKTVLTKLLDQYIRQQEPAARIIMVFMWDPEEVRKIGGWEAHLRTKGWQEGKKTFFIFDGAQSSYEDFGLWGQFFKELPNHEDIFAIAFATYGSPTSRIVIQGTSITLSDRQRVALRPINHDDDIGAVGLLLSRMEFDDLIRKRFSSPEYYFHPSFFDVVFDHTGGHVGAICDFVEVVTTHNSYRALKGTPDRLYTWELFMREISIRDFFLRLETTSHFSRGLPLMTDLQRPPIAHIFFDVLRNCSLARPYPITGQDGPALSECFRNGWLHADRFDGTVYYSFASRLHSLFVEWKLWDTVPTNPSIQLDSILQLALKVIAGFSPRLLSAERRIGPGCIQRPLEAQYQDEFYRSCHAYSPGSLITLPEYGTAEGRVDFYIPSKNWGVQLLRDGNRIEEHSDRFSESGPYARTLLLSDYIILDFRKTRPGRQHPNIPKLYHVVFSKDYLEVSILDHLLQPVHGGFMLLPT